MSTYQPDDPTPTTGGPVDHDLDDWPEGCRCYLREDADWGDVLTRPPGGCPVHSCNCLDGALGGDHAAWCIHTTLNSPAPASTPWAMPDMRGALAAGEMIAQAQRDRHRAHPGQAAHG